MALYWPDRGVALEVVDDPTSTPFLGDEDVEVMQVTSEELEDPDEFDAFVEQLADMLGEEVPDDFDDDRQKERWLRSLIQKAVMS